MSTGYQIQIIDQNGGLYFFFQVVNWARIFSRDVYWNYSTDM